MTLSCLIVEASLYSQVNNIVPISASPKLLDILFFYAIVRLFVVALVHVINSRWLIHHENQKEEARKETGCIVIPEESKANLTPKKTNLITPLDGPNSMKVLDVPAATLYLPPEKQKNAVNGWTGRGYNEKKFDRMFQRFKVANIFAFFISAAVDILATTYMTYYVVDRRAEVFNKHFPNIDQI